MSHCPYSPWKSRRFILGLSLKSIPEYKIFLQDEDWQGRSFDPHHPKLFARVERQTIFPVPGHSLLVFTIRTFFVDVATLPSVDKQQISQCLDSMDEDILRYKGLMHDKSLIQDWLQSYFNL